VLLNALSQFNVVLFKNLALVEQFNQLAHFVLGEIYDFCFFEIELIFKEIKQHLCSSKQLNLRRSFRFFELIKLLILCNHNNLLLTNPFILAEKFDTSTQIG